MQYIKIENVDVYGLDDSIKASKYSFSVNPSALNSELTNGIKNIASAPVGTGHDNFLQGIIVQFDLTIPIKMWTELQRYHFMDIVSSCSTIHSITKFNIAEQCDRYVDPRIIDILREKVLEYNRMKDFEKEDPCEERRKDMQQLYLEILMSVPCGFNLTARMTTNYRQLKTIVLQRSGHILPHWKEFCDWCHTLPMFDELTQKGS